MERKSNELIIIPKIEKIEGQDIPVLYNGEMYYEAVKEKTIIKNYIAEVNYKGTLQKEEIKSVTFNIKYKEIPQEESKNYIPVIATATTGIVVISGITLWKRKKKDNQIS